MIAIRYLTIISRRQDKVFPAFPLVRAGKPQVRHWSLPGIINRAANVSRRNIHNRGSVLCQIDEPNGVRSGQVRGEDTVEFGQFIK